MAVRRWPAIPIGPTTSKSRATGASIADHGSLRPPHQSVDRHAGRPGEPAAVPAPQPGAFPLAGSVDHTARLVDVVDLLALDGFVTGREPFGRTRYLENVRADAALTTDDARVIRDAVEEDSHGRLSVGDGWTLHVTRWLQSRRARVTVT